MKITKEEKNKIYNILMIALALALVFFPLVFAWHIEIAWEPTEGHYTNGFKDVSTMKIYHIQLYALIATSIFASGVILYNLVNKKQ